MKHINLTFLSIFFIICFSCKNDSLNSGESQGGQKIIVEDVPPTSEQEEFIEDENNVSENNESNNTEECRTCGKILNIPTSRNCSWCNKLFDGWSPSEHSCTYVIDCSAEEDSKNDFSFNIHNGCDWEVEDRHFCSLKCESEYNNR